MTARILTAVAAVALLTDTASAQQFRRPFPYPQVQPTYQPPQYRPLPVVTPVMPVFPTVPTYPVNPFPSTAVGQVVDPFTGVVTRYGTTTNPFTGTIQQSAAQYDPYTGTTITNSTAANPFTGQSISTTRVQRPLLNPFGIQFPLFPR